MNYKIIGALNVLLMSAGTCFAQHKTEFSHVYTVKEWIEQNQHTCCNEKECLYYKKILEMIKDQPIADLELANSSEKNSLMHKNVLTRRDEDKESQSMNKETLLRQWMVYASLLE